MLKNLNFYFIRHGETQWNELQLFQGSSDSPLTLQGIHQAELAGKVLKDIPFEAAYSSYQKRAVDTTKYIIGDRDIPHFFHEGLIEIDFGKWEGKFVPDFYQNANFVYFENEANQYSTLDNHGESFQQLLERSVRAINSMIKLHNTGNILVVSHGTVLRQLIYVLTGGSWHNHLQSTAKLGNTSISIVNYKQDSLSSVGLFSLKALNQMEHVL